MSREKDRTFCPKCHRMYCEGYWGEGVCTADMQFCGEPTADGDEVARCVRVWYEAHREGWRDRAHFGKYGRMWERGFADEFMLGLLNEVHRVQAALNVHSAEHRLRGLVRPEAETEEHARAEIMAQRRVDGFVSRDVLAQESLCP